MIPTVHLLATVRKPQLLEAALLVFRTLRVGFPTAQVHVWGNGLNSVTERILETAASHCQARFRNLPGTSHDAWIEALIEESLAPFWICDTDMVFWSAVEHWFEKDRAILYAGRFEPEFDEEWTQTRHVARLHTSLMWCNPAGMRSAMRQWMSQIPAPWRNSAHFPFIRQHFIPVAGRQPLFYDTCAGLYQAVKGKAFTEQQNRAFDHLHCATYADAIALDGVNLEATHREIYGNIELARNIREKQDAYYARRKPKGRLCR